MIMGLNRESPGFIARSKRDSRGIVRFIAMRGRL